MLLFARSARQIFTSVQVARAIHEVNPRQINESVLRDFEDALDALGRP